MSNRVDVVVLGQGGVTVNTAQSTPSVIIPSSSASVVVPSSTPQISTIGLKSAQVAGAGTTPIIRNIIMAVTGTKNPRGANRAFQYNDNHTEFGGANHIQYTSAGHMLVSGTTLVIHSGKYKIEAPPVTDDALLVKDTGNRDLFRVDTKNKKILFTSFSDTEYYIGVGNANPQEKFHVSSGNARFDDNVLLGNDVVPLVSNSSNVGSADKLFKNFYGNLEYKYVQDGIFFLKTSIPTGTESYWISYGKTLPYVPKVVCNLVAPTYQTVGDNDDYAQDIYIPQVAKVQDSGFYVSFSAKVLSTGMTLDSYVSAYI